MIKDDNKEKPKPQKAGHRNPSQLRYREGRRWERKRRQARNLRHQDAIQRRRDRGLPTADQKRAAYRLKIYGPPRPVIVAAEVKP